MELALEVPELEERAPAVALPPGPILRVERADPDRVEAEWSGPTRSAPLATAVVDGSVWSTQRGRRGDLRMDHSLARFHLDAPGTTLLCAPANQSDPAWRRLLLDTALVTASLTRGLDALHAGAVVIGGQVVAIGGPSGAGKTTLLLELLRGGARFLTDDVLALVPDGEQVWGQPGPPVANLPAGEEAEPIAERMHRIGDEWWSRIRDPHPAPAPVSTVVVLERVAAPAPGPVVAPVAEPVAALLALGLQSGPAPQRRERRLEVLAQLAQTVDVLGLSASGAVPARQLAAQLLEALPRLAP